jgi:GT2 family glycosyltransferase
MKISIVVPAHSSTKYLVKLITSSQLDGDKHDIDLWIYLHSDFAPTIEVIEKHLNHYPIKYFPYKWNRGLARTWNDGMLEAYQAGADVVIICNDDIYFSAGDIDKLATKAITHRENYIVSVTGWHDYLHEMRKSHGYSCFAINPIAIEKIGAFDNNFHPAYFEDLDHHRRATMLGLVEEHCHDTSITHGGSQTILIDKELSLRNMATQRKNLDYFRRKWNSDCHLEGYSHPFNNPHFSLYIDPKDRDNPYPGYNRDDVPWLVDPPEEIE